jgi:hypothetical protein
MNRRALLSRLPLLAALPWLARWLGAEPSPVAPLEEPWGRVTVHYMAGDPPRRIVEQVDYWPPGDGWMIYEASTCLDQWNPSNTGATTRFIRHRAGSYQTTSHFEPGRLLCRRLGDWKP